MIARTAVAALAFLTLAAMAPEPQTGGNETTAQAVALINDHDYAAAIDLLEAAIERNEQNPDFWNLLGFAKREIGQYESSETYYHFALRLDPQHRQAMAYLGELYLETGRPEQARELLARLVDLCPDGCPPRLELEKAIAAAGS